MCSLHTLEALEESRVQDQFARHKSECRSLLVDLVEAVEQMYEVDIATHTNQYLVSKRKKNKRISAPGRMANPYSLRLTPSIASIEWTDKYHDIHLPMHVDVGCARGRSIERLSHRSDRSQWNQLGIEIRPDVVKECLQSLQKQHHDDDIVINKNLHFIAFNFSASAKEFFTSLPMHVVKLISIQVHY
jgi:tRNA G46 methylase TrmB